jgi:hypothetical protein
MNEEDEEEGIKKKKTMDKKIEECNRIRVVYFMIPNIVGL